MKTVKQITIEYFTDRGWTDTDDAMVELKALDEFNIGDLEEECICWNFAQEVGDRKGYGSEGVADVCEGFVQAIRAIVEAD